MDKIEFTVELENFEKSEACQVMKDRVGVVQAVKITDTKGCRLILTVTSELCGGAIKVCCFCCCCCHCCCCRCSCVCVCVCVLCCVV